MARSTIGELKFPTPFLADSIAVFNEQISCSTSARAFFWVLSYSITLLFNSSFFLFIVSLIDLIFQFDGILAVKISLIAAVSLIKSDVISLSLCTKSFTVSSIKLT
ncbi:MAG: hypothetical protein SOY04_12020 [Clostridium celatum]|nr:hypothetical protein [Clostridium celatum]